MTRHPLGFLTLSLVVLGGQAAPARSAPNDWAEGRMGVSDGATRDFFNRGAALAWRNMLGDWSDADGASQGPRPFVTTMVMDTDTARFIEWDVTALVAAWVDGKTPNQGFFLRATGGTGNFRSREAVEAAERPELVVEMGGTKMTLAAAADTHLDGSTYQSLGNAASLSIGRALVRFSLGGLAPSSVTRATLRLFTTAQYGNAGVGVFRATPGEDPAVLAPVQKGIAAGYLKDEGIAGNPDVIFFDGFEATDWKSGWSSWGGRYDVVAADPAVAFLPLTGNALRGRFLTGENLAFNGHYALQGKTGSEPDEIYFRYYLLFGSNWDQTVDGGKMPGIAGTYGRAGWGGRAVDGMNGWSARGSFSLSVPPGNPLEGLAPIGSYIYHMDQATNYGDIYVWTNHPGNIYAGLIPRGQWRCIEQHVRMNTLGAADGVFEAWVDGRLAFQKTDFRFRTVDTLKVEEIWVNVYHGGTSLSPRDQNLYIDNVVVARKYIGPMVGAPEPVPGPDAGAGGEGPDDGGGPGAGPDAAASVDGGDGKGAPGASDGGGCGCRTAAGDGAVDAGSGMGVFFFFLASGVFLLAPTRLRSSRARLDRPR